MTRLIHIIVSTLRRFHFNQPICKNVAAMATAVAV